FDRHEARNRIHALCFELDQPAKLRLLLARSGEIALEAMPLPAPVEGTARCVVLPLPVVTSDWRLRHKSSDRGFYEAALAAAREQGTHEALFVRDDGLVTEGSFTNIFVERGGKLLTPSASLGLLPGVLRRKLIEEGRAQEAELTMADLADGFFIGNATRGLIPARLQP
ncbi:MAG: aminotransferase class IV, partial [Croceibacterium sp.]